VKKQALLTLKMLIFNSSFWESPESYKDRMRKREPSMEPEQVLALIHVAAPCELEKVLVSCGLQAEHDKDTIIPSFLSAAVHTTTRPSTQCPCHQGT
jgi:hypothetical protein